MTPSPSMPRRNRLRRVVILCQSVARNLAYYRVGWRGEYRYISDYSQNPNSANFWRVANANFIDMCVLEWCKLFADKKGKHHWEKIVADPVGFKAALLHHLGLDEAAFAKEIEIMVRYRDKFLAHLDSDEVMNIPNLDIPKKAAWFYYSYLVANDAMDGNFAGFDPELDAIYGAFEREAETGYRRVR
jgi:hypothetical protein